MLSPHEMMPFSDRLSRRSFLEAVGCAVSLGTLASTLDPLSAFAQEGGGPTATSSGSRQRKAIPSYAMPYVVGRGEFENCPKRILVVVDYQVDFVDGGVFGRIEPAVRIEEALCERIAEYQECGDIVIYTMDTHPPDNYEQTREGAVNPPHCIPGTEGWEVYGRVREFLSPEKALLVKKGTYGAASLPFLVQAIRDQGTHVDSIEIAGVSTTCRVLHNAILLYNFFPELPLVFDESTTAGYTDERTAEQLDELEAWGFVVKRSR